MPQPTTPDAIHAGLIAELTEDDTRVLSRDLAAEIERHLSTVDDALSEAEIEIGTARTGQIPSVRHLIENFANSGWVPRSKPDTWPAEFDDDPDRDALVKLHAKGDQVVIERDTQAPKTDDDVAGAVDRIVELLEDAVVGIYMIHGLIPEAQWERVDEAIRDIASARNGLAPG